MNKSSIGNLLGKTADLNYPNFCKKHFLTLVQNVCFNVFIYKKNFIFAPQHKFLTYKRITSRLHSECFYIKFIFRFKAGFLSELKTMLPSLMIFLLDDLKIDKVSSVILCCDIFQVVKPSRGPSLVMHPQQGRNSMRLVVIMRGEPF